jgi:crotonobetainyl-CoA:carnitine CoA-transferase CaiB-like acyl-CoA transferase
MPGHDINFQAMAGTLGYSPGPQVPLLQLGDMASGMYAALGILGALVHKRGPVYIDVPITASLLSWMVIPASAYLATGNPPTEGHSLVFGSTPYYNLYRTSDGKYMAVAAIEEVFWRNLVRAMGIPRLEHKRFGTQRERGEVTAELKRVFSTKTREEWADLLMDKDTCATPVLTIEEALTSEWSRSLSMLTELTKDETILNGPLRAKPAMRTRRFTRAPSLGDDTHRIMTSLGYSKKQVAVLSESGVIQ